MGGRVAGEGCGGAEEGAWGWWPPPCNPPPAQESRRRRSANKEARRHRDNSNAAPITNVFCCYTANFLFAGPLFVPSPGCPTLPRLDIPYRRRPHPRRLLPPFFLSSQAPLSLFPFRSSSTPATRATSAPPFRRLRSRHIFLFPFFLPFAPLSFPPERQHIKTEGVDWFAGLRNADSAFLRSSSTPLASSAVSRRLCFLFFFVFSAILSLPCPSRHHETSTSRWSSSGDSAQSAAQSVNSDTNCASEACLARRFVCRLDFRPRLRSLGTFYSSV